MADAPPSPKRFRIAFSFAGEKRDFVAPVAALLAEIFGEEKILYDQYHEAELAEPELALHLPNFYKQHSDLIVAVFCADYENKEWPSLEWRAIFALIKEKRGKQLMLTRFDLAEVQGLHGIEGFIELDHRTPQQVATLILQRLAINEGLPRDHYLTGALAPSSDIDHSSLPPFSNLPGGYIGRVFVGREEFLARLRASLLRKSGHATAITQASPSPNPQSSAISGLGGIGKTHAAVEYAYRHRGDYSALLFVSGDSPQKLDSSLAGLCGVLQLDTQGGLPPEEAARVALAVHWLASHHGWLLIVDNVDDQAAASALTGLLARLTTGHVLITSRLHGFADNVEPLELEVLVPDAATDLLLQLTDKQRRRTADDPAQARKLADLLEGLPLALHQAAGYINEQRLTFAAYLAIYEQEAADLLGWFNDLRIPYERPDKLAPRPVLITWKTSFDKLDAGTRQWLLVFAHFAPEPIPEFLFDSAPDAKPEVKAWHRSALKALAQAETYCLLARYDEPPRFKIHRLVQHITRLSATKEERAAALDQGIQLFDAGDLGNPTDVRSWHKWTPLQPHAVALCAHAPDSPAPGTLSWLLDKLGRLLQHKSLYAEAEPLMRRALQIDEASYGPNHPEIAPNLNNLAALLMDTNQPAEAEPLMRQAVDIAEATYGANDPRVAIGLSNLSALLQATNRLAEAEPLIRRAVEIVEASFGANNPSVATSLNNLAQLLQVTHRMAEAETLLVRVVEILENKGGEPLPNYPGALSNLAQLLQTTNRLTKAEPLMCQALQLDEANYGPTHPKVATRLSNLAGLLQATHRLSEAEPLMRRALKIDEACYGTDHPSVATRLNNLAQLLQTTNRLAEAEPLMRRALKIEEASYGPDHPRVATFLNNFARLLQATDRLAEAEPLYRRALTIDEASYGVDHPDVAIDLNNLASLLQDTHRLTEAEPLIRRALGIFVASLGVEHPNSQGVGNNYLALLQAMGLEKAEIEQRVQAAVGMKGEG